MDWRRKTDLMRKRTKGRFETKKGRKAMEEVLDLTERKSNNWFCLLRGEVSCQDVQVVPDLEENKKSVFVQNNQELEPRELEVGDCWLDRRGRRGERMREDLEEERIIREDMLITGEMTNLGPASEDVEIGMRMEAGDPRIEEETASTSMMTEEEMAGGTTIEDLREDAMNLNG